MLQVDSLYGEGDPKLVAGVISSAILSFSVDVLFGLVGALLAWVSLRESGNPPNWFRGVSRFFALFWFPLIPVGTILGFFMLKWARIGHNSAEAA